MRYAILASLGLFLMISCASTMDSEIEIEKTLINQQRAWNQGDIPGFMKYYLESESLTFAGASGVTKGHKEVLERYMNRYDTPEKMGKLTFTILEFYNLSAESAVTVGEWSLMRKDDNPSGYFTLIWKKVDGNWKIIHDHTS